MFSYVVNTIYSAIFENPYFNPLSPDEEKQLFEYCEKGDLENIKSFIERINPEKTNECGETPLHLACKKGHLEIAELLIKKMKNLDLFNKFGNSPLRTASEKGYLDIVPLLLNKGANIEAVDTKSAFIPKGSIPGITLHDEEVFCEAPDPKIIEDYRSRTPLHIACAEGHTDVVKLLLDRNANLEATTKHGKQTPLHHACRFGKPEIVELLVNRGANILAKDTNNQTPLELAKNNSFHSAEISFIIYEYGLKKGIYQPFDSPLLKAWEQGETYRTNSFIRAGFSVKDLITENRTLFDVFYECCKSGHYLAAKCCFKDEGLKVDNTDDEGNTLLQIATKFHRPSNLEYMDLLSFLEKRGEEVTN